VSEWCACGREGRLCNISVKEQTFITASVTTGQLKKKVRTEREFLKSLLSHLHFLGTIVEHDII